MKTIIVASTRAGSGKTSLILGLAGAMKGRAGYMKPMGDRLFYHKKKLWDHDPALFMEVFGMDGEPEDLTIGFEHAKMRYVLDGTGTKERLEGLAGDAGRGRDVLFVEGGRDLWYGASVGLDALSVAEVLGGGLVAVLSGGEDVILDDCHGLMRTLDRTGASLSGVVLNKTEGGENDREALDRAVGELGLRVLGNIPREEALMRPTAEDVAEVLFAKVLAGDENMGRTCRNIFVASMGAEAAARDPALKVEGTLVITSGDRTDMILIALDAGASTVVLTNNHLPPTSVQTRARELGTPLLLVGPRTYQVARQIEGMEPLITARDSAKLELLPKLVGEKVRVGDIIQ